MAYEYRTERVSEPFISETVTTWESEGWQVVSFAAVPKQGTYIHDTYLFLLRREK